MSEPAEQVAVFCPSCGRETVHEVLKPGGQYTVQCTECQHTHKTKIAEEREVELDVIVSQDGESVRTTVEAPAAESVAVGEEFIVDTDEAIQQVRVTAIDIGGDRRVDEAAMADVGTVWTRVVDNVKVNVTLHPREGSRDESRGINVYVPGDHEFVVGEVTSFGDEAFEIIGIQVRDDATGYRRDKFDHEGDMVFAKDVKRVYGNDENSETSAWSAW